MASGWDDPKTQALLAMGAALMQASGPQRYPQGVGALGTGLQAGLQQFALAKRQQQEGELAAMQGALYRAKEEQRLRQQQAEADLARQGAPQPLPQLALAEGAAQGDVGPTIGNAVRLEGLRSNPMAQSYSQIPPDALLRAQAAGVNITPYIKLNEEARPDVMQIDAGNEVILKDRKTSREIARIPKGAAPGARPFEASDITPGDYRGFLTGKATAGASRSVTNVNSFAPASEVAQGELMRSTRATFDQLKQAPVLLDSLEKAKALVPGARGFMGTGGESLLEAAKFMNNRLGMNINTEGVTKAEELRTRIFFNIMDNLKKMDASPSQQQQQVMKEALGNLGTDPNALPQVLDAFGDVIRGKVDLHNKEVQGATQRGVKFPYDPTINLPEKGPKKFDALPPAKDYRGKTMRDTTTGKLLKSDGMSWRPAE